MMVNLPQWNRKKNSWQRATLSDAFRILSPDGILQSQLGQHKRRWCTDCGFSPQTPFSLPCLSNCTDTSGSNYTWVWLHQSERSLLTVRRNQWKQGKQQLQLDWSHTIIMMRVNNTYYNTLNNVTGLYTLHFSTYLLYKWINTRLL